MIGPESDKNLNKYKKITSLKKCCVTLTHIEIIPKITFLIVVTQFDDVREAAHFSACPEKDEKERTQAAWCTHCAKDQPNDRFLDFLSPLFFFGNSHEPGAGMAGLLSWYPIFLGSHFWSFQLFERCSYNILGFFRFTLQIRAQSLVLLTCFSCSQF